MFLGTTFVQFSYHLLDSAEDSKDVVSIPFIALHFQWCLLISACHQKSFFLSFKTVGARNQ